MEPFNQKQKDAQKDDLAQNEEEFSDSSKCKAFLKVTCVREDSKEGIAGITVKADTLTRISVNTGLADFGAIDPKMYAIEIELSQEDGAKYKVPDAQQVEVKQGKNEITLKITPRVRLDIVLIDKAGNPIEGATWTLTKPLQKDGRTEANGKISIEDFPWDENDGTLNVTLPPQPVDVAPLAAGGGQAAEYPPPIKPDDFRDEKPKTLDGRVKWTLDITDLEKREDDDGVAGRLHNLGFSSTQNKERAVKAYQRLYMDQREGSGKIADVKDDVKQRHDNV